MATIPVTARAHAAPRRYTGILDWLTTTDHKKIGILYLVTTFIFFLVGGLMAEVIRIQIAVPHDNCYPGSCGIVSQETYDELFTMHGSIMIFLWIIPVFVGFANYFLPLMIGARDMAFPRLNALSFWLLPMAGILMLSPYFFGGWASDGWTAYPPVSSKTYSPGVGTDYWILGLHILSVSSIMGAINILVTTLTMRTKGMHLFRMPLFVWTSLVTAFLTIVTNPVLSVNLALLLLDRNYGTHFFKPATPTTIGPAGDPILWQYLFWFYSHPAVYIMILPGFGIISEVLPVFSRKPIFGYRAIVYSTVAIASLGMMVFGHHMFAATIPLYARGVFMTTSLLISVPTGVKLFNWLATIWGGHIRYTPAMLFALAFLVLFLIGGITGVYLALIPVDTQLTDTYFVVAHIHYVLFGGSVFTILAGLHYWMPKISGRVLNERIGQLTFWLTFIGFNLTFMPQHWLGLMGMVRRTYAYPSWTNWGFLNMMSTIGALILGLGILCFIINFLYSIVLRGGKVAGNDPWQANTLEWATSSPPPPYNFEVLPEVGSARPVRDMRLGIRRAVSSTEG